jgi:hypothetical protein
MEMRENPLDSFSRVKAVGEASVASKGNTGDQARSLLARWRQMLRRVGKRREGEVLTLSFAGCVGHGCYPEATRTAKRHGRGALRISLVSLPLEVGLPLASVTALQPQWSWQAVLTGAAQRCAP